MFGRNKKPTQSNFEVCSVKDIKLTRMYQKDKSYATPWEDELPDYGIGVREGVKATLDCPRTENYIVETSPANSPVEAVRDLGVLASEAVCANCPYPRMTRAEVYTEQAQELRAQTDKIEAETAYHKALEAGRSVLQGVRDELEEDRQKTIQQIGELRAIEGRIQEG